LTADTMN